MRIRFRCQSTECDAPIFCDLTSQEQPVVACPECGRQHPLFLTDAVRNENRVQRCVLCEGEEMYVLKDFPQAVGLLVVVVAAITSCVLLYSHTLAAFGVLVGAALLDWVIYLVAPRMTVCYRCGCRYRDFDPNPHHRGFDLATSDKYN